MDPSVSVQDKPAQDTQRSLQKFLEPDRKPKVIYTDNSLEFGKACEDLSWNHCTSTPHRSETNGIAERAVRRVKEGTSAVLLQSGLNESWWADSMGCFTYLRNVTDLLSDGKTPYERRFGHPLKGPIIPFGSLVEYHPITAKDQSGIHQFGQKVLPGLFLGYALYAWRIWKGDVLIADLEEFGNDGRIGSLLEKTQCERGDISQTRRIYFSNSRWTNQNTRRRSRTENIHLGTASTNSRRGSRWLSWRIRRVSSTTSRLTSGCRWSNERFLVARVPKAGAPHHTHTASSALIWIVGEGVSECWCRAGVWCCAWPFWVKAFALRSLPTEIPCASTDWLTRRLTGAHHGSRLVGSIRELDREGSLEGSTEGLNWEARWKALPVQFLVFSSVSHVKVCGLCSQT